MGSDCMAVATWIDNIFTFANNATNALAMAYDCENHLVSKWGPGGSHELLLKNKQPPLRIEDVTLRFTKEPLCTAGRLV